jgi:antagonist of KipI
VLGSAAHHARAGLGASPLTGQGFRGRSDPFPPGLAGAGRWIDPVRIPGRRERTVRVWPGPQAGAFGAEAVERFLRGPWTVDPRSDRIGYRLAGSGIPVPTGNLESEPVLPGSVQVPPDGRPIVTLPDGPTLGGYPKIGWVDPRDLWKVAQTPPGGSVVWQPMGWEALT